MRHSLPFFDVVARRRLLLRFISVRRRRERIGIRNGFQGSSFIHLLPMRMKQRGRATTKSFSFEQPRVLQNKGRRRGGHSNDAAGEQSRLHSCKPRACVSLSSVFIPFFCVRERTCKCLGFLVETLNHKTGTTFFLGESNARVAKNARKKNNNGRTKKESKS